MASGIEGGIGSYLAYGVGRVSFLLREIHDSHYASFIFLTADMLFGISRKNLLSVLMRKHSSFPAAVSRVSCSSPQWSLHPPQARRRRITYSIRFPTTTLLPPCESPSFSTARSSGWPRLLLLRESSPVNKGVCVVLYECGRRKRGGMSLVGWGDEVDPPGW